MSWYMKYNCGYVCEFSNNTNYKTDLPLSHHTKVCMVGGYMVGRYVHGGSHKTTELSKFVGRRLHRMDAYLGQYSNKKLPALHG